MVKSPECLLGSGDPWVASWQIGKLANHRLRVLHIVLNRCSLFCTISFICKWCLKTHFKLYVPLKTYQGLPNDPKQHGKPSLAQQLANLFATHKSPNPSKHSWYSNNAEPSLQISKDLPRLGSISVTSKLTSQNKKNIYLFFWFLILCSFVTVEKIILYSFVRT